MPVELPKDQKFSIAASSRNFGTGRHHTRHSHEFFELIYVIEGCTRIEIRDRVVEAGAGELAIFYPGEDHLESVQPGVFSTVCLRFAADVIDLPDGFPSKREAPPVVRLPWPERFQNLFEQMIQEQRMEDAWHETMSGVYLVQFVVMLRRALASLRDDAGPGPGEKSMLIENAMELIHSSLDTNLSLGELAARAYMSESYFSHAFKDIVGLPPKKYQTRAKMLKAKELLQSTTQTVKEVASALGYEDQHYFSRVFKKVMGIAPSEAKSQKQKKTPS